jgi:hypothetical protein
VTKISSLLVLHAVLTCTYTTNVSLYNLQNKFSLHDLTKRFFMPTTNCNTMHKWTACSQNSQQQPLIYPQFQTTLITEQIHNSSLSFCTKNTINLYKLCIIHTGCFFCCSAQQLYHIKCLRLLWYLVTAVVLQFSDNRYALYISALKYWILHIISVFTSTGY